MKNTKIWLYAVLFGAMPSITNFAFAAPLAPTLVSKSDGFSVWLPGKPKITTRVQQVPGSGDVQVKYYSLPSSSVSFVIMPMNLPGVLPAGKVNQFLDGVQRGFTGAPGAKLLSSKNINSNGAPGRELVATARAMRIQGRFFVTSQRSYQVLAISPGKNAAPQSSLITKVLNSFRILKN